MSGQPGEIDTHMEFKVIPVNDVIRQFSDYLKENSKKKP